MQTLQTIPILRILDLAKARQCMRPGVEAAPQAARVTAVVDPCGNRLRFNEDPAPR